MFIPISYLFFFFSSRRRHTRCALVTGVQTCALPICNTLSKPTSSKPDSTLGASQVFGVSQRRSCSLVAVPRLSIITTNTNSRSEEHTSELQSLMRISYAVFCLKKTHMKKKSNNNKSEY